MDFRAYIAVILRRGVMLALALAYIWSMGLLWFIGQVPRQEDKNTAVTDAIVVLTGGTLRVEAGFDLLAAGRGKKLFISGVGHGVGVKNLMASLRKDHPFFMTVRSDAIVLGYDATDTRGNAAETAAFMQQEHFTSLRLVTANYHMPRAVLEFRRVMPDVEIIQSPVFPERFMRDSWWMFPGTFGLVLSEYHKYIGSAVETKFGITLPERIRA